MHKHWRKSTRKGPPQKREVSKKECLCQSRGLPGSVHGQAQFYGGTPAGTWQWRLAGSTRIWACLGRLRPISGRALGCLGLCLAACGAGPDARQAMPGDRDWQGETDPCRKGSLAIGTRPHPPRTSAAAGGGEECTKNKIDELGLQIMGTNMIHIDTGNVKSERLEWRLNLQPHHCEASAQPEALDTISRKRLFQSYLQDPWTSLRHLLAFLDS